MKVIYDPKKEQELIGDMGKALQFMLDYCACTGNCSDCDFKTACYNLSKLSDEFVSIGGGDDASKH